MTQPDLLKPLVDAIETAKKRINLYRGSLREDETRTRVALIDPVLRALGWDVSDPRMVTPEYNVRGHKPDYGLHKPVDDPNDEETVGNLVAILEAKRLEEKLQNHYTQMTEDAENARLNYAGITDGDNWELYRFVGGGLRKEWTPVMQVRLTDVPTYAAAIKLLVLWRPNLASGQLLDAETSIVGPPTPDDPPTPKVDETNVGAIKERQREAGLKAAETRRRRNPEREALEAAVYADRQAGMSYRAIAKKHGLHPGGGSTWSIVKRIREREGS